MKIIINLIYVLSLEKRVMSFQDYWEDILDTIRT